MIILQAVNVSKSYGVKTILSDINMTIQSSEKIGLVGNNGVGKSTLLKILSSMITPDSGEVQIKKNAKIGYLAQDSGLESNNSIWNEMLLVFLDLIKKEKHIRNIENNLALIMESEEYDKLMEKYSILTEAFREEGGYSYEAKIRGILHGLGFTKYDYSKQLISTLSGGQKTRLALAKILLNEPELLILDEPTNYLDINTLTWLEGYLKIFSGALLIVSHDRFFLDSLTTTIYELHNNGLTKYNGNYSRYVELKENLLEQELKKYREQQAEVEKMKDFIQKNISRASTTKRAQSKRKALEKMELIDKPKTVQNTIAFSFDTDIISGNNVLIVKNLIKSFNNKLLFDNVSFQIYSNERVSLIGPNGVGKSTLLKMIIDSHSSMNEQIKLGTNIKIGYYDQEQENLSNNNTIIDEIWDENTHLTEMEVRNVLGNFLFSDDDIFKKIDQLSGGEKARVSLAKLMLKKANFLVLDEPTNHLDIYSREILEKSLLNFNGTIFFTSHDRYLLNRLSTRTLELSSHGIKNYLGNYDYYHEKKEDETNSYLFNQSKQEENKNDYVINKNKQKKERQLKRKIESIEAELENMELQINDYEQELIKPEVYSNHLLSNSINEKIISLKNEIEQLINQWEEYQKELELIL